MCYRTSAYASNGADAREWIQTRAALAIRTTATMATGPNAADFLEDASMPDSIKVRTFFLKVCDLHSLA
jgi:hypothetical protein